MNISSVSIFFTMWLHYTGDAAKLYTTKHSCAANMTVRKWFATYNGLCDSLDSCAL